MPPFTDLEGQSVDLCYSVFLKSLAVLYLYKSCIILVSPFNWLCYVFLVYRIVSSSCKHDQRHIRG